MIYSIGKCTRDVFTVFVLEDVMSSKRFTSELSTIISKRIWQKVGFTREFLTIFLDRVADNFKNY